MTRPIRPLAFLICLGLMATALPVRGQSNGLALGDLRHDQDEPIEINAETLEVDQAQGTARFSGNVVVVQGGLRLAAGVVEARYADEAGGGNGRLSSLAASERVLISAGTAAAEADRGSYDIERREIVMTGNVVLTQTGNVLSGQRLVINTATGTGRMEGGVRTVLQPGGGRRP